MTHAHGIHVHVHTSIFVSSDVKPLTHETHTMHWYHKVSWVIYNISSLSAIIVTLLFWALLYPAYKGTVTSCEAAIYDMLCSVATLTARIFEWHIKH